MVVVKRSLEASNPSGSRGRLKTFERLRLKIKLKETSFMPRLRRVFVPALSLFWLISNSATALADASGQSLEERLAKMEAAAASAQSAGDNAWMLVSAALVLMMTGPGLALFYGGLVRKKNVLGTMMQSFILMAPITDYAGTIPQQTFMVYQLMFAIITPALISGAFAERMRFSAMMLFTVIW